MKTFSPHIGSLIKDEAVLFFIDTRLPDLSVISLPGIIFFLLESVFLIVFYLGKSEKLLLINSLKHILKLKPYVHVVLILKETFLLFFQGPNIMPGLLARC